MTPPNLNSPNPSDPGSNHSCQAPDNRSTCRCNRSPCVVILFATRQTNTIIGIGAPAAEIERVSDAERSQAPGGFGHAFENEAMEAVARVWIGASESFVEQHRQMELIGDIDGEIEGRVGIRPPVHLTPVEDIFAAGADGGRVEGPRALVHLYRNSRRPERPPQAGSLPHGYNERTDASLEPGKTVVGLSGAAYEAGSAAGGVHRGDHSQVQPVLDRKSTRLNSSH